MTLTKILVQSSYETSSFVSCLYFGNHVLPSRAVVFSNLIKTGGFDDMSRYGSRSSLVGMVALPMGFGQQCASGCPPAQRRTHEHYGF